MISHRTIDSSGLRIHVAEAGEGPLVVLLHGFPELWYSYRHQLTALAGAGYHAVALDQRGYGQTDAPADIHSYSLLHLAGDVVAVINAMEVDRAAVVGHDWGSPVASTVGLLRPDLIRGVALLSVPYTPRSDVDMLTALKQSLGPNNYQVFFQEPGVAERAFEADVRRSVVSTLVGGSGDAPRVNTLSDVTGGEVFGGLAGDAPLPNWITKEDVDYFTTEFERTGYRGGLNWYRNSQLNWELMAAWHHAPLRQPSLFVGGDRDAVCNWPGMQALIPVLRDYSMPGLTKSILLEGCGHWTQQERPDEVNALLVDFLSGIDI